MNPSNALLLSIRPEYAHKIFTGEKTVELRRVRPRIAAGDLVILYASGKMKSLVGAFQVKDLASGAPGVIWSQHGTETGISSTEFDLYFTGVATAYAIQIARTWRLEEPIRLEALRKQSAGFRPPQGFHYLSSAEALKLGGAALMGDNPTSNSHRIATTTPGHTSIDFGISRHSASSKKSLRNHR